jgi:isopentenyl-diphosphate Delta-isomerase
MNDGAQIVFVHETGTPTGEIGPKLESHTGSTKLHLAFSCYIFRHSDNTFLMTQRASGKKVWPGVWTNSLCGHPMPGERIEDAIWRRAKYELGIDGLMDIKCVLPTYRYTTPPYNGIIENEFCPVFIAYCNGELTPNSDEVEMYRWLPWRDYAAMVTDAANKNVMSYWAKDQYIQLKETEPFVSMLGNKML